MSTQSEVQTLIDDCAARDDRLTAWEHDFIVSLQTQMVAGRTLTPKQIDRLTETWERVTSAGGVRR